MAFVRRKTINGKDKFYLVENKRIDGKVRQKVLAYLGESDTVEGAIAELETQIEWCKKHVQRGHESAKKWESFVDVKWLEDGKVPPRGRVKGWGANIVTLYWESLEFAEMNERYIAKSEARLEKLRSLQAAGYG